MFFDVLWLGDCIDRAPFKKEYRISTALLFDTHFSLNTYLVWPQS